MPRVDDNGSRNETSNEYPAEYAAPSDHGDASTDIGGGDERASTHATAFNSDEDPAKSAVASPIVMAAMRSVDGYSEETSIADVGANAVMSKVRSEDTRDSAGLSHSIQASATTQNRCSSSESNRAEVLRPPFCPARPARPITSASNQLNSATATENFAQRLAERILKMGLLREDSRIQDLRTRELAAAIDAALSDQPEVTGANFSREDKGFVSTERTSSAGRGTTLTSEDTNATPSTRAESSEEVDVSVQAAETNSASLADTEVPEGTAAFVTRPNLDSEVEPIDYTPNSASPAIVRTTSPVDPHGPGSPSVFLLDEPVYYPLRSGKIAQEEADYLIGTMSGLMVACEHNQLKYSELVGLAIKIDIALKDAGHHGCRPIRREMLRDEYELVPPTAALAFCHGLNQMRRHLREPRPVPLERLVSWIHSIARSIPPDILLRNEHRHLFDIE